MIYPSNAADKLGFTEIKDLIKGYCLSDIGRQLLDKVQPMYQFEQIDKFLRQTHEFRELLTHDSPLPIEHLYPLRPLAEKARVEGVFLTEEEFLHLWLSLKTVFAVISYFNERDGQYPNLEALFEHLPIERGIIRRIEQVLDDRGKIKSNASPALHDIISSITKAEGEARRRMDQVFRNAQQSGWTADGSLTIRDGRMCIPILDEKNKVTGAVAHHAGVLQRQFGAE